MKKHFLTAAFALALVSVISVGAQAQEKKTVGEKIESTANKVGNKTAEVAVKGSAKVADKTYKGKIAPDGTNVYIDGRNRKYYVDKKGGKVYLKASQIRNKVD